MWSGIESVASTVAVDVVLAVARLTNANKTVPGESCWFLRLHVSPRCVVIGRGCLISPNSRASSHSTRRAAPPPPDASPTERVRPARERPYSAPAVRRASSPGWRIRNAHPRAERTCVQSVDSYSQREGHHGTQVAGYRANPLLAALQQAALAAPNSRGAARQRHFAALKLAEPPSTRARLVRASTEMGGNLAGNCSFLLMLC